MSAVFFITILLYLGVLMKKLVLISLLLGAYAHAAETIEEIIDRSPQFYVCYSPEKAATSKFCDSMLKAELLLLPKEYQRSLLTDKNFYDTWAKSMAKQYISSNAIKSYLHECEKNSTPACSVKLIGSRYLFTSTREVKKIIDEHLKSEEISVFALATLIHNNQLKRAKARLKSAQLRPKDSAHYQN